MRMTNALVTASQMALVALATSVVITWVLVNAITGCGETFHTPEGDMAAGECVLVPWAN